MMPENSTTAQRIKTALVITGALLAVLYIGYILYDQQMEKRKREQPAEFLVFSGLPANTKIDAILETGTGIVPLKIEKNKLVLDDQHRLNFYLPFKLTTHLELADGTYHDLVFTLDKRGVNYSVLMDGFQPYDPLVVTMNGAESTAEDSMDWSGRYLSTMVFNLGENMSACIDIKTVKPFGFCQTFPVRDEAQ